MKYCNVHSLQSRVNRNLEEKGIVVGIIVSGTSATSWLTRLAVGVILAIVKNELVKRNVDVHKRAPPPAIFLKFERSNLYTRVSTSVKYLLHFWCGRTVINSTRVRMECYYSLIKWVQLWPRLLTIPFKKEEFFQSIFSVCGKAHMGVTSLRWRGGTN